MFPAVPTGQICMVEGHLYWGQGSISGMKRSQEGKEMGHTTHVETTETVQDLLITLRILASFPEGHWGVFEGILTGRSNCIDCIELLSLHGHNSVLYSCHWTQFLKLKKEGTCQIHFSSCTTPWSWGFVRFQSQVIGRWACSVTSLMQRKSPRKVEEGRKPLSSWDIRSAHLFPPQNLLLCFQWRAWGTSICSSSIYSSCICGTKSGEILLCARPCFRL